MDDQQVASLPVSETEMKHIDDAIAQMVKLGRRRSMSVAKLRLDVVLDDLDLCRRIDELISETLTSLKRLVPDDAAEKLFDRIARVVDGWADRDEQVVLGVIFFRFMDTITCLIAYKRKFRGISRSPSMSKADALAELKIRGLAKR